MLGSRSYEFDWRYLFCVSSFPMRIGLEFDVPAATLRERFSGLVSPGDPPRRRFKVPPVLAVTLLGTAVGVTVNKPIGGFARASTGIAVAAVAVSVYELEWNAHC